MAYFNVLSNNNDKIRVQDIVNFMRDEAHMNPKKEELEAILRRCDHEADQMISYEEFCEIVSSNAPDLAHDNIDEK